MKKVLCKILTVTLVVMMVVSTTAFAAEIASSKTNNELTVTVTGLTAGEESTLLVVDAGTKLEDVTNDTSKIFYIDQITAADGSAEYKFDVTDAGDIDIYSGYATMDATSDPLSIITEGDADADADADADSDFTYGDVNKDGSIDGVDAGAIIANFLNGAEFTISGTTDVYEFGANAADVNADSSVDGVDAGAVIAKFLNGSPLPVEAPAAE